MSSNSTTSRGGGLVHDSTRTEPDRVQDRDAGTRRSTEHQTDSFESASESSNAEDQGPGTADGVYQQSDAALSTDAAIDEFLDTARSRATYLTSSDSLDADARLLASLANDSHPSLQAAQDEAAAAEDVQQAGIQDIGDSARSAVVSDSSDHSASQVADATGDEHDTAGSNNSDSTSSCWDGSPDELTAQFGDLYDEVVRWRRNLFMVPYGAAGTAFVQEISRLVNLFVTNIDARCYVWPAIVVGCQLLLQRPFPGSKAVDHAKVLTDRLQQWSRGQLNALLDECRCLQAHIPVHRPQEKQGRAPSDTLFAKLVFNRKTGAASRYLSRDTNKGILKHNDAVGTSGKSVLRVLQEKHPLPSEPPAEVLLEGDAHSSHQAVFRSLTSAKIRKIATRITGAAGPSGLDATAWTRMLTVYKAASNDLCAALARMAVCLCTEHVESRTLAAFLAARLIPLDKNPGVRPIAVGEVFRRIIGKAIMEVIEGDVMRSVAPTQLCVGIPSACEIASHAVKQSFASDSVDGALLVDANNAFNSVNRIAALHNIPRVCPSAGTVFANCYREPIPLLLDGGEVVWSREGTCQGDPLAMAFYALATQPLVKQLAECCPNAPQVWYADDDAAVGKLKALREYWDCVSSIGPGYGYYVNAIKTTLLVKPSIEMEAYQLFADTGITVTSSGASYLGCPIGSEGYVENHIQGSVQKWMSEVEKCASFAETQPHAAYHVMVNAIQHRWSYALRVTAAPSSTYEPLDNIITQKLLPKLCGHDMTDADPIRQLLTLPARNGGINIPIPSACASSEREASLRITEPFVGLLFPGVRLERDGDVDADMDSQQSALNSQAEAAIGSQPSDEARQQSVPVTTQDQLSKILTECRSRASETRRNRRIAAAVKSQELRPDLSQTQQLLVEIAGERGVSSWLTIQPTYDSKSILSKQDFGDALAIRYGLPLTGLPASCVCGSDLTIDHALVCPCGGYPAARHDEIRDVIADVLQEVNTDVEIEPRLLPLTGENLPGRTCNRAPDARLDIRARGFWTRQQDAFFDVRVTHPKASMLACSEVQQQLLNNEREKKRQYGTRVAQIDRGSFTPLVFATNGQCAPECSTFLKSLVGELVNKNQDLCYSRVMQHLRCKLSFCLLRWAITCMRGCRGSYTKRRGLGFAAGCRQLGLTA